MYNKKNNFHINDKKNKTLKDKIISMEYPIFMMKSGFKKIKTYTNGNIKITLKPGTDGLATIFDKDIWIYAISKLQKAIKSGIPNINNTVAFTPCDFFSATNRFHGGKNYKLLEQSLCKLKGTVINISFFNFSKKIKTIECGLIESWNIIEKKSSKLKSSAIYITIPKWIYISLHKKKIPKTNPEYFKIRKPISRRMYEIACKNCKNKKKFSISLKKLYLTSGSNAKKFEFKRSLKTIEKLNNLPDYKLILDKKTEIITFKKIKKQKNSKTNHLLEKK